MIHSRRHFFQKIATGSAGLLFTNSGFASGITGINRVLDVNDEIQVAVIGVNGQGMTHVNAYKKMKGVRIAAICDADTRVLNRVVSDLSKEGIRVKPYTDLRKLYEDREVDAVSIALPNHWHSLATVWACQAGKHVCVEKPVSHSIWEGRKMVEAARKYNRLVQADLDSRSNVNLALGIEYMQKNLGKVLLVRIMNYKRRPSIGKIMGPGTIPDTVDFDLWTGPAPMQALSRKNLHYDWHWQWFTGNSELGNNGPHQLDICRWGLGKTTLPTSVYSFGGRFGYLDDGQTPNTQVAVYDYEGIPVIYDSRGLGEKKGVENMDGTVIYTATGKEIRTPYQGSANCVIYFICENGVFYGNKIYDNNGKLVTTFKEPGTVGPQFSFVKALRSGKIQDLKADILDGHLSAVMSHMGNISYQLGRQVSVEDLKLSIQKDPFLGRVYQDMEKHLIANEVDLSKEKIYSGPVLYMDSAKECFVGPQSNRANLFVKDNYRHPFIIPEQI